MPLLTDDEQTSGWIFDSLAKKQLVSRLFTNMSGSVICSGTTKSVSKKRKATSSSSAPPKAKAKAKAKSSAHPGAGDSQVIAPEDGLEVTTVNCQRGVRQKLWVDDMVMCINHAISSAKAKSMFKRLDNQEFETLKKELFRVGLTFAIKGSYLLPGTNGKPAKLYRKWSSLRPALQTYAVVQLVEAETSVLLLQLVSVLYLFKCLDSYLDLDLYIFMIYTCKLVKR